MINKLKSRTFYIKRPCWNVDVSIIKSVPECYITNNIIFNGVIVPSKQETKSCPSLTTKEYHQNSTGAVKA